MPILPQKRAADTGIEELARALHRPMVKNPPPKFRVGVQVRRDFPPGCGPVSSGNKGKMVVVAKATKEGATGSREPLINSIPAPEVKSRDIISAKDPKTQTALSKSQKVNDTQKELIQREKIKEAMKLFDDVYAKLFQENRSKAKGEKIAHWRVPVEAVKIVKQQLKWLNEAKKIGAIRGVEVGDEFRYRSQLQMVGLHCQPNCGIDYISENGYSLAISIVDSHRYSNERESSDVLLYSGQGGVRFLGSKQMPEDQKLERGNLALSNSKSSRTPVRVIRKLHKGCNNEVFVYDGLYNVTDCTQERGKEGKLVFMFKLTRVPGQPQVLHSRPSQC